MAGFRASQAQSVKVKTNVTQTLVAGLALGLSLHPPRGQEGHKSPREVDFLVQHEGPSFICWNWSVAIPVPEELLIMAGF